MHSLNNLYDNEMMFRQNLDKSVFIWRKLLLNNNKTYLHKASSWQTKIKQVIAQCHSPYNAKLKLVYIIKYFHLLTSSQWWSMQWNSPLVRNGMPQGTIDSSCSSIGNWVSCLHDWLLFSKAINYSRLSQLIDLRNLTNPTR